MKTLWHKKRIFFKLGSSAFLLVFMANCGPIGLVNPGNLFQPKITSVTPSSGMADESTHIQIAGSNFVPGGRIVIGDVDCSAIEWVSETLMTCTVLPQAVGAVSIKIFNPNQLNVELANAFTFIDNAQFNMPNFIVSTGGGVTQSASRKTQSSIGEHSSPVIQRSNSRVIVWGTQSVSFDK